MKKALMFVVMMGFTGTVWAADAEANKKILRDALVGAVTGAVAVEATEVSDGKHHHQGRDRKHPAKKNFHEKKKKDKKRPHGWDMGKKTGWGDKDIPPGLAGKDR